MVLARLKVVIILWTLFIISSVNAQTAPSLSSPANGTTNAYTNQTFSWSSVPDATYQIQISTGSGFWWNQIDVSNLTTTSYQASGLYMYTPYYWRVAAITSGGTTFSSTWQFTTGQTTQTLDGPTLVFPANNATNIQTTNTFSWNSFTGASSYKLQISTTSNFTSNQIDITTSSTSYQASGLYYSTGYYWRVGAVTTSGTVYSSSWQFTTGSPGSGNGNPGPILTEPTNGSTNIATNGTFTWQSIVGSTSYRIQISTSSYFGYNQVDVSGLASPNYTVSGLYLLTPYYWRVNATSSSGTTDWSATYSFTTSSTNPPPGPTAPILATPVNGTTNISLTPTLVWNTSQGATSYNLQVSTSNQFSSFVVNTTGLDTTSYNLTGLGEATTYYWRVSATNSNGTSGWSSVWDFITTSSIPAVPVLVLPTNGSTTELNNPTLTWNSVQGATIYNLQLALDNQFTNLVINQSGLTDTTYNVSGLTNGTQYYWRVNAGNTSGTSTWSDSWTFTTTIPIPPIPTLSQPTNNSLNTTSDLTFSWIQSQGAVSYDLQIANNEQFTNLVLNQTGIATVSQSVTNLAKGVKYYWRVRAINSSGTSNWSNIWNLTTAVLPELVVNNPIDNFIINNTSIAVSGMVNDNSITVFVNGIQAIVAGDKSFATSINLLEGNNTISIAAKNVVGDSVVVVKNGRVDNTLPLINLAGPVDGFITNQSLVNVNGNVQDATSISLNINGIAVTVNSNGEFTSDISLQEGINTITITATDEAGNITTLTRSVRRDSASPVLTITAPTNNLVTNLTSVNVVGNVTASTTVTLTINENNVTLTNGIFTAPVTLVDGINIITITATDAAENVTTETRIVRRDSASPVLTITAPTNNLVTNLTSVNVVGTVTDSTTVTLTINGNNVTLTNGSFTVPVTLADGNNTITIIATDAAGNAITETRTVRRDATPPTLTVTAPTNNLVTNLASVNVAGTVTDSTTVTLTINGNNVTLTNGSFTTPVALVEGINTIAITATDAAGNMTNTSRDVTLDTIIPVLAITNPENNSTTNQVQLTVVGNVNKQNAVVTINGDTLTVGSNGDFTKTITLVEGSNSIAITAKDEAGNNSSLTRLVRLDTVRPLLTVSAPIDGLITNQQNINIAGTVSDSTNVLVTVNQDTVQVANGSFNKSLILIEGLNTIVVKATDAAGNSSTINRIVRLDSQNPSLTVTYPQNNFTTDSSSVHIIGQITDSTAITIKINNQTVLLNQNGGFNHQMNLVNGNNNIEINATDAAGNLTTLIMVVISEPLIIPIDPALIAPKINDSYAKTFYDANSFLWKGANAIQYDVDTTSIEETRVGVVRGTVITMNGEPLPGVKVFSPNHPEWGHTYTRADGKYDFGLNAGGYLVVNFERRSYLPATRIFNSPWNKFVVLDTVALATLDNMQTVVNFNQPFHVAQASVSNDISGTRRATIFFEQGTIATMTLPDNSTQILDSLTARATEYTVGQYGPNAMPANLPSSVSYTYCTDLTADEALAVKAKSVTFDKPIRLFTENFIGFPVGTSIPTGIWDWETFGWLPRENGTVIKIVGVTNNLADISITTDDAIASVAKLDSLGITDAERSYISSVFNVGQTVWRTRLTEFGVIDQGFATIQPDNAETPKVDRIERFVNEDKYGSLSPSPGVDVLNQTLHKEIGIAGTQYSLTYSSDRVEGRKSQLIIPLTGTTIQPSLVKIILKVTVLGVEKEFEYAAAPNLSHTFIWDGKDAFGREAPGRHKADILVGYVHLSNYQVPNSSISSFGFMSGVSIPNIYSRETTTLWQCAQEVIGGVDNRAATLGGWNLNIHNGFDQVTNTVYLGSGQNKINDKLGYVVETIGGNGLYGSGSNNVLATSTRIARPTKLAIASDGSIYFIELEAYRIRKINPDGIISTVAGNGQEGSTGDGGPATSAQLYEPTNIALDKEGNLYILQGGYQSKLRKVDINGIITTVIGTSGYGFAGDGGPASEAKLWRPNALEFGPDGSMYIADQNWVSSIPATPKYSPTRIRKVDPDGIITTVAGGVETLVANPQSVPATQVRIEKVEDLQFGPDGDLYILSSQNYGFENPLRNIILKLGKDGRLHKITHGGYGGVSFQEGITANNVYVDNSKAISFDRNCSVCYSISNPSNQGLRIGIITPDYLNNILSGKTATQQPSSKTGTPARIASLNFPNGLKTGPDGSIYFTEELGNLIRKLTFVGAGKTLDEYSVNSNSGKEKYFFNISGKHIRTEEALTAKKLFTFSYDAKGRLITIKDVDSLVTTIERDTAGTPTAIISPRGERTELAVNIDGYLSSVSNPNNETVGLGYMTGGLLSQFTDPKNNSSLFGYDAQGRLTSKQVPDEGAVIYSKQKTTDGYTVTETKPLGEKVVHRIYNQLTKDIKREVTNAQGVTINVKDLTTFVDTLNLPDGSKSITETGFDPRFGVEVPLASKTTTKTPAGLTNIQTQTRTVTAMEGTAVKSMTEDVVVNTKTFKTEYTNKVDGVNNYVKSTSAEGRITEKFYDEKGRLIKEIIPGAGEVEYYYMQNKLTRKVHYPETTGTERTEFYFYDSKDRLVSSTDPMWQADSMQYDNAGRLTRYVFKDGRSARFNYDAKGNLTSIIPPGKTAHVFEFDKSDKKTGYKPPVVDLDSLNAIRYVYDEDGKLLRTVYPDASAVQMIYDTDNCNCTSSSRVKSIAYDRGIITYNYNTQSGQVTSVIKSNGDTLSYTYDGSLPKTETWKGSALGGVNGNVALTYYNDFRVTEQKINNANSVVFAYDKDGLMTQAGAQKMKYTSAGQLIADTLGNITSAYTYTDFGELKTYTAKVNGSAIFSTDYIRDQLGRITQLTETNNGTTNTFNYGYDTSGRLVEVKKDGNITAKYVYDSNGNRLAKVVGSDSTKGIYDEQDRLLQYGNEHYIYNKNGYLTTKYSGLDTTKYTYDNLGNLLLAVLPNGTNIEYVVDANNRRIAKRVNGIVEKRWLFSGELTPIVELDSANNVTARFVYGTKSNIPDYIVKGDTTYKIISDHLGSPRLVINLLTGAIKERIDYNEYGEVLLHSGTAAAVFGYAGGLYDEQTKLVRFGARDYNATTGRWTAKDPIDFEGDDYNLYGYVLNDPVNNIDNAGTFALSELRIMQSINNSVERVKIKTAEKVNNVLQKLKILKLPVKLNKAGKLQPYATETGRYLSYSAQEAIGGLPGYSLTGQFAIGFAQGFASGISGAEVPEAPSLIISWGQILGNLLGSILSSVF